MSLCLSISISNPPLTPFLLPAAHQTSAGSPAASPPAESGKTPEASGTWLTARWPAGASGCSQRKGDCEGYGSNTLSARQRERGIRINTENVMAAMSWIGSQFGSNWNNWQPLTLQQVCKGLRAGGGDWECQLIHGNTVGHCQGVNLPVWNFPRQQLPQQNPKTEEEVRVKGIWEYGHTRSNAHSITNLTTFSFEYL